MSSKSKSKGSSWEREIATHLSKLYGETFIRVPNSGAYIGGLNTARKQFLDEGQIRSFKGDIIPPSTWIRFNSEAKNYADFPFHLMYDGQCKQLDTWLEQLMVVSDPNDFNILMFKITRKGKYVAVQNTDNLNKDCAYTLYRSPKYGSWVIFDYDAFWQLNAEIVKKESTTS